MPSSPLAFECIGDCCACELGGSRLTCEGDQLWADYELEWERD